MKKTMMRTLSLVLTICLIAGLLVVPAAAVEGDPTAATVAAGSYNFQNGSATASTTPDTAGLVWTGIAYDGNTNHDGHGPSSGTGGTLTVKGDATQYATVTVTTCGFGAGEPTASVADSSIGAAATAESGKYGKVLTVYNVQGDVTFTFTGQVYVHSLKVEYAADAATLYTVGVANDISNGTVTVDPVGKVPEGTSIAVTATAADGYELVADSLKYGDTAIEGGTFNMPAADTTVTAQFAEKTTPEVQLDKTFVEVEKTATGTVTATVANAADATVTWTSPATSSNESVATATVTDGTVTVTPVADGDAQITVEADVNGTKYTAAFDVVVWTAPVTSWNFKTNAFFAAVDGKATAEVTWRGVTIGAANKDVSKDKVLQNGFNGSSANTITVPVGAGENTITVTSSYTTGSVALGDGEVQTITAKGDITLTHTATEAGTVILNTGASTYISAISVSTQAVTEPTKYTVTYAFEGDDASFTAPTLGAVEVEAGSHTLPNAPAVAGFTFDGWYVGNEKITATPAAIEVTDNVTVTGKYTKEQTTPPAPAETKTITFTVPEGVTLEVRKNSTDVLTLTDGKVTVGKSDNVTFTITLDEGYELGTVTGAELHEASGVYTVNAEAVEITASKVNYTITKADATNGSFAVKAGGSEAATATMGTEVTVEATPASGYELDKIEVKDADNGAVAVTNGKFTMPAKNVTVTVTFKAIQYTVTVTGGTASPATAAAGTEITLTPTVPAGKYFTEWTVTAGGVTIADNKFTMPAQNVTVAANFADFPSVVPANLGQIDDSSVLPTNGLASTYKAEVKGVNGKEVTVEVSAAEVTIHANAEGAKGAWLGFGMPVEEGKTYSYKLVTNGTEGSAIASIAGRTQVVDGKTYNTVYDNLSEIASTTAVTDSVVLNQYVNNEGAETLVWTWKVTFKANKVNAEGATVVDKGALDTAITTATAAKEGVKTSADGADVPTAEQWVTEAQMKALTDAITAAQGVMDKTDATQTEVDEAAATLNTAVTTFNGQKQAGTKVPEPTGPAVKDAEIVFITAENYETLAPTYNYYGATAETLRPAADVQLPWLLVKYDRAQAGTVTIAVKKDNAAVGFGSGDALADTLSFEAANANANAWISFHMVSQADTDHKSQTWLNQAAAAGAYEVTVTMGDDTATATATYTEPEPPEADKTELLAAIQTAQAKLDAAVTAQSGAEVLKTDLWATAAEKTALTQAIAAAKTVAEDKAATEAQVAEAVTTLNTAVETNLHAGEKAVTADDLTAAVAAAKEAVEDIIVAEDAASVKKGKEFVTQAVKDAYNAAIEKAEAVMNNAEEATPEEIEAALAELNEATLAFNAAKQEGTKSSTGGYRPSGNGGGVNNNSTDKKTETLDDGTQRTTETAKDGTVTVTDVKSDGTKTVTTTTPAGEVTTDVTLGKNTQSAQVSVPVDNANSGLVAVIVKADGTEEIIRDSVVMDGEVVFDLDESAKVKIVNNAKSFVDMPGHWAQSDVDFVSARDLFNGVSDTHFAPDATMTRGMMATVLFRLDGETKSDKAVDYSDVTAGDWFAAAVDWASEAGVINGYTDGSFGPNRSITREELVVMIYRYAGAPEVDATKDLTAFEDADQVSAWAQDAMNWAVANGIINGKAVGVIDPKGDATRAEVSAVLQRYVRLAK